MVRPLRLVLDSLCFNDSFCLGQIENPIFVQTRGVRNTYSQVADLMRMPGHTRRVGYALSALFANVKVPCSRSLRSISESPRLDSAAVGELYSCGSPFDRFFFAHKVDWAGVG